MKSRQRRSFSAEMKARIALEAIKEQKTIQEIASHYGVHPSQVMNWKRQAIQGAPALFADRRSQSDTSEEELKAELYQQIGQLQVELDWLKKKSGPIALEQRRGWISENPELSIRQQCRLTGISRSGWYYEAEPETAENLRLMRFIDEQYTRTPFYGIRKMTWWLGEQGYAVNPKRVRRLMRQMGLEAIYRKPRLSVPGPGHRIYPYRLRGLRIDRPNQVWSSDITYIRLRQGFLYLAAVMDWFSRYVLAWEVSVSLDTSFCLAALDWALQSGQPDIFNTDQGSQFTSEDFTRRLETRGIVISMDGRGRVSDNIFIERLWRTVKYEEVYLKDYIDVLEAVSNLKSYFGFYNHERPHQALGYQTPAAIYFGKRKAGRGGKIGGMLAVERTSLRRS
ncbi:MAG: IS3 family transposase [Candidatus Acidiferrales bacterium]